MQNKKEIEDLVKLPKCSLEKKRIACIIQNIPVWRVKRFKKKKKFSKKKKTFRIEQKILRLCSLLVDSSFFSFFFGAQVKCIAMYTYATKHGYSWWGYSTVWLYVCSFKAPGSKSDLAKNAINLWDSLSLVGRKIEMEIQCCGLNGWELWETSCLKLDGELQGSPGMILSYSTDRWTDKRKIRN